LGEDGAMKTGWHKEGNQWYYLGEDGAMKTGWHKEGSEWYYLQSNGVMKTGLTSLEGTLYFFNNSGNLVSENHVIVNKRYALPDGYRPRDLVVPNVNFVFSGMHERRYMRKEAAEALEKLFKLAQKDGITLKSVSGFRSQEYQSSIYQYNVRTQGKERANRVSAKPRHSEHQTGLAMDVSASSVNYSLIESFGTTEEGKWLAKNAHQAGFIIRYLKGKESITGYIYEPWHIRYVGDIAKEIFEKGITLEEYHNEK
ncbi:hypothetical protein COL86_30780, partial [Bacillus toyonensis]